MTPAAPPSAETVWLRIGYTFEITATSRRGSVSAMAMAARRPAPPPPTIRTSCAARTTPSLTSELLVRQHLSAVVDDHVVDAAVVELFPGAPAAAGVAQVLGDQTLVVLGHVLLAAVRASARCEPWLESGGGSTHGPPPLVQDSDLRPRGPACSVPDGLGRCSRTPLPAGPCQRQRYSSSGRPAFP